MRARAAVTAAAVSLLAGAAAAAVPAGAATGAAGPAGGGCSLSGNAVFNHGPSTTDHPYTYTFSGTLANCQDSSGSGPAGGRIATVKPATGSGTCAEGTTAGVAYVAWSDRTGTVVKYTTQSVGAEVVLQGTVVKSVTVGKKVYRTTRYAGASALADLAFQADPTQCAGSGVTKAPITGVAGLGRTG